MHDLGKFAGLWLVSRTIVSLNVIVCIEPVHGVYDADDIRGVVSDSVSRGFFGIRRKMKKSIAFALCGLGLGLSAVSSAELIYGMTTANSGSTAPGLNLVSFDSATPGTQTNIGAFTGVVSGHSLRSIDFNTATGVLYAISSSTSALSAAQLYTVDLATGALTAVGSGTTLTGNNNARLELEFNSVTGDFNVFTGAAANGTAGNNFVVNAGTGVATSSPILTYGTGASIIGAAFNSNTSTMFGWDYNSDDLVSINPATGVMTQVAAPTGFLTGNAGLGMDHSALSDTLYVVHDDPGTATISSLLTRDMVTGAETIIGGFGAGVFVSDISVAPIPEPFTMAGLGAVALIAARRRNRK
jgi:hypothetical protein